MRRIVTVCCMMIAVTVAAGTPEDEMAFVENEHIRVGVNQVRELYKKLFQWELQLERPIWQLKRKYEHTAMDRYDRFRQNAAPGPSGK